MALQPVLISYDDLAKVLEDMTWRVRAGDSFEGSITYGIPEDEAADPHLVEVRGTYRIGNSEGQGGMRVLGTFL